MKHDDRHPPVRPQREPRAGDSRKASPEPRRERAWRIGAAQMAAPSTRTWRRAGRYSAST